MTLIDPAAQARERSSRLAISQAIATGGLSPLQIMGAALAMVIDCGDKHEREIAEFARRAIERKARRIALANQRKGNANGTH